jgi:hypothetical protein
MALSLVDRVPASVLLKYLFDAKSKEKDSPPFTAFAVKAP